jgi:hypothetical protein
VTTATTDTPTTDERAGCWQSVQCPDGLTACGSTRDGWTVLGPGNAQLARYGPELAIRTAWDALERYRQQAAERRSAMG